MSVIQTQGYTNSFRKSDKNVWEKLIFTKIKIKKFKESH
jgi:hypothetical protein